MSSTIPVFGCAAVTPITVEIQADRSESPQIQIIEIRVDKIAKNIAKIALNAGAIAAANVPSYFIWNYYHNFYNIYRNLGKTSHDACASFLKLAHAALWARAYIWPYFKLGWVSVPQITEIVGEAGKIFKAHQLKRRFANVEQLLKEMNVGGVPSELIDSKMPKVEVIWKFGKILGKEMSKVYTFTVNPFYPVQPAAGG